MKPQTTQLRDKTAILAIGDKSDFDSFQKLQFNKRDFRRCGFIYHSTDYERVMNGVLPSIGPERIVIFLFFPFTYWNDHIEHKNYRGVYGNRTFHRKFVRFWKAVEDKIRRQYAHKRIFFINRPHLCAAYRDKLNVINTLREEKIPQPTVYDYTYHDIRRNLTNGQRYYLKPRFGSMGKGITFLSRKIWKTNFIYQKNRIVSLKSDYGWRFEDITGNDNFLKALLGKDIIVERGMNHFRFNGDIVDLRVYVFLNEVIFIYPRRNRADRVTTNISQGGRGAPRLVRKLPRDLLEKTRREARRTTTSLDIGFVGMDIIPDPVTRTAYVIDVNLFAGFPRRQTFNMARHLAESLRREIKSGRLRFT